MAFSILPKNWRKNKQNWPTGPQVDFLSICRLFFGIIEDTIICFWDFLTFSNWKSTSHNKMYVLRNRYYLKKFLFKRRSLSEIDTKVQLQLAKLTFEFNSSFFKTGIMPVPTKSQNPNICGWGNPFHSYLTRS